ncbi:MAG: hypothetical protein Aurels2KO_45790 [Aureliella sp.]
MEAWSYWIALGWCIALLIVTLAYFALLASRSSYNTWESILYAPVYLFGRLLWRVHFTNSAPAALDSGGILVANHRSSVDPFFVQLAASRRIHWMVAKEYCVHPIFGPFLRLFEVIPTNRSGVDTASTKHAIRISRAGRLVGMFPEGELNHTDAPLLPVRSGAAMVAARANVPLIPLYIKGSPYRRTVWSPVFMPARVGITFGEPIFPDAAEEPESQTDQPEKSRRETLAESDELIMSWARRVVTLAGSPAFPVSLASKRKRRERKNRTSQ